MSSIRRFLQIEDVVYEVFSHLSLIPYPLNACNNVSLRIRGEAGVIWRTLAAAALTCRVFSEPASRALWAVLPFGILPLLKTFSCLVMKERQTSHTDKSPQWSYKEYYELDGDISAEEWHAFTKLASRVRCLQISRHSIESSVLEVLASHCERSNVALLPNLQVLHWPESRGSESSLRLLKSLCATSRLSLLRIFDASVFTRPRTQAFAVVCSTAPHLLHFRSNRHLSAAQISPILSLRNLRTLFLPNITFAAFLLLGDIPHLWDLSTRQYRERGPRHVPSSVPPQGRKAYRSFPSLRRFKTSGSIEELVAMIQLISSPRLIALSIHTYAAHTSDIIPRLAEVLTLPVLISLERLHLHIHLDAISLSDNSAERNEIAFDDLARSIIPIRSLSVVNLHVSMRFISLSDMDIFRMKSAWPHLTALSVRSFYPTSRVLRTSRVEIIRPSICSLVDLALDNPQVEGLDVEVASIVEEDVARLEERAAMIEQASSTALDRAVRHPSPQPSLNWLTFARGDYRANLGLPEDIGRLARVLLRLLPRVGGLGKPIEDDKCVQSDGARMFDTWSQIDMEEDIFRLLEKLETLKSQPFSGNAILSGGFPV